MKEIYLSAIQSVIDIKLTKEELWEIIGEHIEGLKQERNELIMEIIQLKLNQPIVKKIHEGQVLQCPKKLRKNPDHS